MAFTLQSCGDDDDNDAYRIDVRLNVTDRGGMTADDSQIMINEAQQMSRTIYVKNKVDAISATERQAQLIAEALQMPIEKDRLGNAVLSYTIKCTEDDGDLVTVYYVDFDIGDVNYYSGRN